MENLRMKSFDAVESNVAKIAALFPHCVTERLNKDGKPELAIDFDKLRAELSTDALDTGEERYQFTWPDKRAASRLANTPTDKTLRPDVDASVDFWNTKNLYIEGDNLEVLKVLRENYLGKVKMIYIDPPYNTGNDFVYNDDFAQGKEDFEATSGLFDEDGNQTVDPMVRNTESNGRFHTDWLNMIYPRLKVARDLLAEDGIIFISIDDKELNNLLKVCNEIFGESNFITNFLWKKKSTTSNVKGAEVSSLCDNTLCYRRTPMAKISPRTRNKETRSYPCSDEYGWYRTAIIEKKDSGGYKRDSMKFPIMGHYPRDGKRWQIGIDKARELEKLNRFIFDGEKVLLKIYDFEDNDTHSAQPNLLTEHGSTDSAARMVNEELFNVSELFTNPKPIELIQYFASISALNDSIILDFFSGSATTAHAVMKLNAEDGGHRKFIMVQLPEVTEEKSEARKAGYETICQIGEERIRRAGKKILEEVRSEKGVVSSDSNLFNNNENSSLLTNNSSLPDVGFRVLKLDSSNMEDVFYTPEDFNEADLFNTVDNVKSDRTPLDLLFQVMPELDIELSARVEEKEVNGKKVFFVDDTYLIATFDTEVNESTVTEIAKMRPQYFVMRDASAANDNVLDNFEQIFRHYSPDTIRKIL
ncbi:site-specific DNA-methyltransferase [uncultured Muribaculum sp.]|uniref:site-specific DNA-methyltransferase n=1 Tax=uncultured Muribaculum sp. TaxID=1918613 RepID=UPI0027322203|nr:site-specific DNA-methyltransferase [uncultured Muribaculum sp.]